MYHVTSRALIGSFIVLMGGWAFADANDELDFQTEAGLRIDMNQEISKQERQIELILKSLSESQVSQLEQEVLPHANKDLAVSLVAKKTFSRKR